MIQTLHISNYALIDSIDITLHEGLNILTGETGAGKSIILGALGLLLGGRADSKVVRRHDVKSVIEASLSVEGYSQLEELPGQLVDIAGSSPPTHRHTFAAPEPATGITSLPTASHRLSGREQGETGTAHNSL